MYNYQDIVRMGELDYERFKQFNQRCLDAGGCSECFCVAAEQGREHWDHCSKSDKSKERSKNECISK